MGESVRKEKADKDFTAANQYGTWEEQLNLVTKRKTGDLSWQQTDQGQSQVSEIKERVWWASRNREETGFVKVFGGKAKRS